MEQWRWRRSGGSARSTRPTRPRTRSAWPTTASGRYDASAEAFRAWLDKHPDGPYSLRARNHLKAALAAYGPS